MVLCTAADRCYEHGVVPRHPMSEEQLKAFIVKVKSDISLQDRLKTAKSKDDVVSIAKEHGHEFSSEQLSQLSSKELEGVAGGQMSEADGIYYPCALPTYPCSP